MEQHGRLVETVGFRRRAELPGIEVRDVENSERRWRCYSTGFEFLAPSTWRGEILHRRKQGTVGPGQVFSTDPGEVFTTPRVVEAGAWSSLTIDTEVWNGYLAEHGLSSAGLELRPFVDMSPRLAMRIRTVFANMTPSTPALELQTNMVELVAALVAEVIDRPRGRRRPTGPDRRAAERVRECVQLEPAGLVDLERLSQQSRLSRYQVLRVFKRRYGLPPHAYALRVRIGRAQQALLAGGSPADVATEHGFVDQSHLSRHFKQIVGVTPAAYARGGS